MSKFLQQPRRNTYICEFRRRRPTSIPLQALQTAVRADAQTPRFRPQRHSPPPLPVPPMSTAVSTNTILHRTASCPGLTSQRSIRISSHHRHSCHGREFDAAAQRRGYGATCIWKRPSARATLGLITSVHLSFSHSSHLPQD